MRSFFYRGLSQRAWYTHFVALTCICLAAAIPVAAEDEMRIDPAQGRLGWLTHPYRQRTVPPINLNNSPRLDSLIRAGNLYLTAQDVVALAIENNLDVEVQRYGPLLAKEVLRRAQAGGALRSVGLGVAAGPQSVSLQGVSVNTSGAAASTAGNGVSSGGGIVTQLGPSLPSLDPTVSGLREFPAHHHPAEQYVPHRNHGAGAGHAHLSRRSIRRTGSSD